MKRNERGITLIALVITVVILLILAGAIISIAINGGDIFGKASQARASWNRAVESENEEVNYYISYLDQYFDGDGTQSHVEITPEMFTYTILTPATGKLQEDGIYDLGKVADLSGTIKIASNTNGTAEVTGINYDYVFQNVPNYPNNVGEGTVNDVYYRTIKPCIETLEIPEIVKLNTNGEYDPNGQDYTVTSIGDKSFCASAENTNDTFCYTMNAIENISIPSSVTRIGDQAFRSCNGLRSITIPESVATVGEETFKDCENVESIDIQGYNTNFGGYAFAGCHKTNTLIIPRADYYYEDFAGYMEYIGEWSEHSNVYGHWFTGTTTDANIIVAGGSEVTSWALSQLIDVSITLPNSINIIRDYAFAGTTGQITIPKDVNRIEPLAFGGSESLVIKYLGNHTAWDNIYRTEEYNSDISVIVVERGEEVEYVKNGVKRELPYIDPYDSEYYAYYGHYDE